jgi:hypothetical protein
MQCTTGWAGGQRRRRAAIHTIAILELVVVLIAGVRPESIEG